MIVRGSNVLRFLIMTWMFFVACWQEAMFKAAHAANAAAATEVPPDFSLEAADGPMAEEGEEEEGGQDDEAVDADQMTQMTCRRVVDGRTNLVGCKNNANALIV